MNYQKQLVIHVMELFCPLTTEVDIQTLSHGEVNQNKTKVHLDEYKSEQEQLEL